LADAERKDAAKFAKVRRALAERYYYIIEFVVVVVVI
jgi:DNA-dependent RNA polymerase auxiliary subunit epsilon